MALAALAGDDPVHQAWAQLLQHRLGGSGVLAGHPVGNLVLTGLLDSASVRPGRCARPRRDPGRRGRTSAADEPGRARPGRRGRSLRPARSRSHAAHPRAVVDRSNSRPGALDPVAATGRSGVRRCGRRGARGRCRRARPGFVVHQRHPASAVARTGTCARDHAGACIVTLNLVPQPGETEGYEPTDLLRVLCEHADPVGGLRIDAVIADVDAVVDEKDLGDFTRSIGASLILSKLASDASPDLHDPQRLAEAYRTALEQRVGGREWR